MPGIGGIVTTMSAASLNAAGQRTFGASSLGRRHGGQEQTRGRLGALRSWNPHYSTLCNWLDMLQTCASQLEVAGPQHKEPTVIVSVRMCVIGASDGGRERR